MSPTRFISESGVFLMLYISNLPVYQNPVFFSFLEQESDESRKAH